MPLGMQRTSPPWACRSGGEIAALPSGHGAVSALVRRERFRCGSVLAQGKVLVKWLYWFIPAAIGNPAVCSDSLDCQGVLLVLP